jgi:hypothetical protein
MAKFAKKSAIVEATQWFKHGDHPWVKCEESHEFGCVLTVDGSKSVAPGDWIVNERGSIRLYSETQFVAEYEAI